MKQDDTDRFVKTGPPSMKSHLSKGFAHITLVEPKYKFSRNWYQAHFDSQYYFEVDEWCAKQFGPHPKHPDAWSRWWHKFEDSILFRDEKDYILFMLRWS